MNARGTKALFRATKAKSRNDARQGSMDVGDVLMRPISDERRELDFYSTRQPEAIRSLMHVDGARLRELAHVWEPAVGDGALAREISAAGIDVTSSDIQDRGWPETLVRSFYDFTVSPAPAIITNPPFSEINARDGHGRWLRHTLAMPGWRYCALLLSWDWPAARANGLGAMLDEHPFTYCYLMRWKLDFTGEGSPPQRNAWFVWDRDDERNTRDLHPGFRWLDRNDWRQGDMI